MSSGSEAGDIDQDYEMESENQDLDQSEMDLEHSI